VIELAQQDGLWIVTINRPDKANSLTHEMLVELVRIAESARDARALILTGVGKVFSAGADLDEVKKHGLATSNLWERLSGAIANLPGLTIAALNGTLAGGANGMALACDLRIAVPTAKFFYPVMKQGVLPQPSDPSRMAKLIGPARTKLILIGGQKLSADEAFQFGLIDRIVPATDLMDVARELTEHSCAAKPEIATEIARLCEGDSL
jgi:enoyl-CoA hydratase